MSDEEALQRVSRQGLVNPNRPSGPGAPRTMTELLQILAETRQRGFAVSSNSYTLGMTAMAMPVRSNGQDVDRHGGNKA